jgi:EAL domain-containing protein (putative c-di-GMP-specific phosphodiesterase class I)
MDATEPHLSPAQIPGSSQATADLLRELSGLETDRAAIRFALQRASEAAGTELCVYVDGELLEGASPETALVAPVHGRLRGHLVLARTDRDFESVERERVYAIARALSLFNPAGTDLLERLALQDELASALHGDEIQTYFLPKVDMRTARVTGVEALVRWSHPERGVLPPSDFLDLAEAGGLMGALTERVIELATRAAGDWWRSGVRPELSVNLPAEALASPDPGFAEIVRTALADSGLSAEALRFEVTEDAVMTAADPSAALEPLTALGASISVDDFGTGHTSLDRLESLSADEVKIDRSFIRALSGGGGKGVVRSTVHLVRQLGLRIVAEGVETEDTRRQLRGMGCDAAQGFLIGAPMPAREFLAWISSWDAHGRELNTIKRSQGRPTLSEGRSPERFRRAAARDRDLMAKP